MENSYISWTDHTFNPWIGCAKVSAGCQHCYAEELMSKRFGEVQWGPAGTRKRTSPANWRKPILWNSRQWMECPSCGWRGERSWTCPDCNRTPTKPSRQRVLCASLGDVFEDRPELTEWRRDLVVMMEKTPHLDWLLLTKRPENVTRMITETITIAPAAWWLGVRNVWIGTSVENQETADERIPHLLKIPAAVRFLSMEPLLGPVDFRRIPTKGAAKNVDFYHALEGKIVSEYSCRSHCNQSDLPKINWVIVGGESGSNARPMHPNWVRSIRDQCQAAGVPLHFKQWGEWYPDKKGIYEGKDAAIFGNTVVHKLGKKAAGRLLDGREWNEYPKA